MKSASIALTLFSACLLASSFSFAQEQRPVYPANSNNVSYAELDKLPDWRGLWFPVFGQVGGEDPVLVGEAKTNYEMHQARRAADSTYDPPETTNNCEPDGFPGIMTFPYSLEFLMTPGKVTIVQEALMQIRRVFTDGRPLPARDEADPNYFGYSAGHWEGETLVIRTVGTQTGQRMGIAGINTSDEFTSTERIYLDPEDENILHLEFTFVDPNVLAQPWFRTYSFNRDRTWEQIEYICSQNDRHPVDDDGQTSGTLNN